MQISRSQMQQGCGRQRVIEVDANGVGFDMLADGARKRLWQTGGVIRSIGLGPGPVSGQLQTGAERMIDLDGRNL